MAFWGVEVKPGKPFTHTANDDMGRLHISQATLGNGTAKQKSIVQCNVGNRSPVFLCSLFPEKSESSQLNLEFEEGDDVVFSVVGPRSVHLTGYYMGIGRHYKFDNDSESYGEDIADTESERASVDGDEDNYEDSFINDDEDVEAVPASPLSSGGVGKEGLGEKKPQKVKGNRKRLKKKYELSESGDSSSDGRLKIANGGTTVSASGSEGEDLLTLSAICKTAKVVAEETTEKGSLDIMSVERAEKNNIEVVVEEKIDDMIIEGGIREVTDEKKEHIMEDKDGDMIVEAAAAEKINLKIVKVERQEKFDGESIDMEAEEKAEWKSRDIEISDAENEVNRTTIAGSDADAVVGAQPERFVGSAEIEPTRVAAPKDTTEEHEMDDEAAQVEFMVHAICRDVLEQNRSRSDYEYSMEADVPSSTEVDLENNTRPKKRKRKEHAEMNTSKADDELYSNVNGLDETHEDKLGFDELDLVPTMGVEQEEKQSSDKISGNDAVQSARKNQPGEKKKMKKKKKKTNADGKVVNSETPLSETGSNRASQVKTFSNGLVIEELEKGKRDGKIADLGQKIVVNYTARLKENGQVFDSTEGGTPFKFRVGAGDIIDGLNLGVEGMHVGEKRRILIPPSLGYGSVGDGSSVPPDAWVEYDVELVKVAKGRHH